MNEQASRSIYQIDQHQKAVYAANQLDEFTLNQKFDRECDRNSKSYRDVFVMLNLQEVQR